MKITKIICKTCKREFDSVRAHKQFCSRKCYKNNVHVKAKYADRTKVYLKKYNLTIERKYTQLQAKCKHKNYKLDITLDKYKSLIKDGCFYCSSTLDKTGVSLDRLNNDNGYTVDNVVPCCGNCNQIRNKHLTHEEMIVAMKAVLQFRMLGRING